MNIDSKWVIDYIKKNGTKIIIPKEAIAIKEGAFDSKRLNDLFGDYFSYETNFEIYFEEGSALEKIEKDSFMGINVTNEILIPRAVEKIEDRAFQYGNYELNFEEDSNLKEFGMDNSVSFPEEIKLPKEIKKFSTNSSKTEKIIIPADSQIETIECLESIASIVLPNGEIKKGEKTLLGKLIKKGDDWKIRYYNGGVNGLSYAILDGETLECKETNHALIVSDPIFLSPCYQYFSIFDVNEKYLDDDEFVLLETDYTELLLKEGLEINCALFYNKQEIIEIKNILDQIIEKVNVPPIGVKDREKIIYAQLVQTLFEHLIYDKKSLKLFKEEYNKLSFEQREYIDSTQNMKGLLKGKTVCKGFSTVINTLTHYFGIRSSSIGDDELEHAWNYLTLDGEKFEDDFTWYRDSLSVSNFMEIDTFLVGIDISGNRGFDSLPDHKKSEPLELSKSISETQKLNLLATDWSKIEDWSTVDLDSPFIQNNMLRQIFEFASNNKVLLGFKTKIARINEKLISQIEKRGLK